MRTTAGKTPKIPRAERKIQIFEGDELQTELYAVSLRKALQLFLLISLTAGANWYETVYVGNTLTVFDGKQLKERMFIAKEV